MDISTERLQDALFGEDFKHISDGLCRSDLAKKTKTLFYEIPTIMDLLSMLTQRNGFYLPHKVGGQAREKTEFHWK